MVNYKPAALVSFIRGKFSALADPVKAAQMAAYMKTNMLFYGVQKPFRVPVYKEMKSKFPVSSRIQYQQNVLALWAEPHREEKYAAITYALAWSEFINPASLPLYRRLIKEGGWWDFVDDIAIRLVGKVYFDNRSEIENVIDKWIDDKDMWIRRSAIISQIMHKDKTDRERLFDYCLRRADEKEFFIRKSIGWALRAYSYHAPEAVRDYLITNQYKLSGLSFREGAKQLVRTGLM